MQVAGVRVDVQQAGRDFALRGQQMMREVETLDRYRVAPLFDNGCGFYSRATTDELPESPSRELKGYAIASLHNRSKADGASARLKLSGVWNRRVGKAYYARRFREMAAGMDRDRAAIVHLAVEGLWYMELAGVSPFTAMERRRIVLLLLRLADGGEIGADPSTRRGPARGPAKRPTVRAAKNSR